MEKKIVHKRIGRTFANNEEVLRNEYGTTFGVEYAECVESEATHELIPADCGCDECDGRYSDIYDQLRIRRR